MNNSLVAITDAILQANRIGIVVHINPDGDSLGSMSAFALLLHQMGKTSFLYSSDGCPENYAFLPGLKTVAAVFHEADCIDLLFTVDCGHHNRIKDFGVFRRFVPVIINIDHHQDNNRFGDLNWIEPVAAVGEMIYLFAEENHLQVTAEIAQSLYVSLYTDTGGFRYSNTTPHTLAIAGKLLETGFNMGFTLSSVYERKKFFELQGLSESLSRVELDEGGKIIWTMQPLSLPPISFEVVDFLRMVEGVEIAIIFKEVDVAKYKVSFRAKGNIDVSKIAAKFGGGGHPGAAGALLTGSQAEVVSAVLNYARFVSGVA